MSRKVEWRGNATSGHRTLHPGADACRYDSARCVAGTEAVAAYGPARPAPLGGT